MHSIPFSRRALLTLACAMLTALPALATEHGSRDEAVAMVKKATAFIKTHGADKAYDEVTNGKTFKDRDLYVIVYDLNGKNLAHGANAKLVGKDLLNLKDPDGFPVIQKFIELAKGKGSGWVEGYKFMNPVTQKMESKAMYLERLGDTLVGCGVYKD